MEDFKTRFDRMPKDVQEIFKKHIRLLSRHILIKQIEYSRGGEIKMPILNVKNILKEE